jgi:hypothetical protein
MVELGSYAQPLRAIGQALELLNVECFEMEPDGEDFLVRGNATVRNIVVFEQPAERNKLRSVWGLLPGQKSLDLTTNVEVRPTATVSRLDLRYTPTDIERLEESGQAKRVEAQGKADAANLSQLLRTIGAYVNQKAARLLKISRVGETLRVEYETSSGRKAEEEFAFSDLYDFWVRMYLKRANRNAPLN